MRPAEPTFNGRDAGKLALGCAAALATGPRATRRRGRHASREAQPRQVPRRPDASGICAAAEDFLRADGIAHPCAINLGRRPTFYEHADHSLLEAHLVDFDGDLYWERARVQFTHFLRSERKFAGIDALVAQLKLDVEHARQLLNS